MLLLISSIFYSYNQVTYNRTALFQKNIARLIFLEQKIGPILESDLKNLRENTDFDTILLGLNWQHNPLYRIVKEGQIFEWN